MPKLGANGFIWIDEWTAEKGEFAISEAARLGFDFIEIPLMKPELFDYKPAKRALEKAGIGATASLILPKAAHMPQYPKRARKFLFSGIGKFGGSRRDVFVRLRRLCRRRVHRKPSHCGRAAHC